MGEIDRDGLIAPPRSAARVCAKRKTWDSVGREIHYDEHPGIGVRGAKWNDDLDPF